MNTLRDRQSGFTYLAALFLIAITGLVLASIGMVWSTLSQRDKERDLLFIGDQFREAIGQYYEHTPGTLKKYPPSLADLLKDDRHFFTQRYLRRIYRDPITRVREWGVVQAPEGGIMGVYSLSEERPIKMSGFSDVNNDFEGGQHYSEWKFVYRSPDLNKAKLN